MDRFIGLPPLSSGSEDLEHYVEWCSSYAMAVRPPSSPPTLYDPVRASTWSFGQLIGPSLRLHLGTLPAILLPVHHSVFNVLYLDLARLAPVCARLSCLLPLTQDVLRNS